MKRKVGIVTLTFLLALAAGVGATLAQAPPASADEVAPAAVASPADALAGLAATLADAKVAVDTVWVLVTGVFVFLMHLGFASVESGFCRAKNTVTIMAKNFIVFSVASIAFLMVGFGIMFGDGNALLGTQGLWFVGGADNSPTTGDAYQGVYSALSWTGVPLWAKFFFQMVFAATAATIVSGSVAERMRFGAFYLFSFFMVALIYPVIGHWIWGGGWLAALGFWDFAGSTVVHSVGGWAGLVGAIMLGPRLGKYGKDGRMHPIPGHSIALGTLGVFILWFGWFGFNPGSAMAADPGAIARIAVTTNTAAAGGAVAASILAWLLLGKPDLTMILNGALAGLVGITAPCAFVSVPSALVIGLAAGALVVLSVLFFDRVRVDDPVGAISVHLVCGAFGTIALGLFAQDRFSPGTTGDGLFYGGGASLLAAQVVGVLAVGAFVVVTSAIVWGVLRATIGIRVSPEEEMQGLDIGEHGIAAYPEFHSAPAWGAVGAAPPTAAPARVGAPLAEAGR